MTDLSPSLGSVTVDVEGHFSGNFTNILICKMGMKVATLQHCYENQREVFEVWST